MNKHRLLYIPIAFLFLLSFVDCAKRGSPGGGKRDSIPPVIIRSSPENFTTNFTGDEISIYFDEFIKLKNIQQNLIVSPPLEYQPIITPLSTSKILKIKILDTLKENTTYSFNFGKSIVDNNEENEFEYFKYVLSTGSFIDSLTLAGSVKDALLYENSKPTTVVLYEVTEEFTDSLIYNEKPTYVAAVQDSTSTYELTNLKEGKYLLLALQEDLNNYTFEPLKDKIGFTEELIELPTEKTYDLSIFKEIPEYELSRPKHESKNHIIIGYRGNADSLKISTNTPLPSDYDYRILKDREKDTLHYWFKPAFDLEQEDTLQFIAQNKKVIDTFDVRLRDLFADSLIVKSLSGSTVLPKDSLRLTSGTPISAVNSEKISVMRKDSLIIAPTTFLDTTSNVASIVFEKDLEQIYTVTVLPEAITDFFGKSNDTLTYRLRTQEESDYGTLTLNLANVKAFPLIVQLVDTKYKVKAETYLTELKPVYFDFLLPQFYYIRIIEDKNANGIWDTGDFLKKIQPENVIYYPGQIEVRPNWSLNETFTLD